MCVSTQRYKYIYACLYLFVSVYVCVEGGRGALICERIDILCVRIETTAALRVFANTYTAYPELTHVTTLNKPHASDL